MSGTLLKDSDNTTIRPETDASAPLPSWTLSDIQRAEVELLVNGSYAPLHGFMDHKNACSAREKSILADGTLWPVPILLAVSSSFSESIEEGNTIALRDGEGVTLATMVVEQIWSDDSFSPDGKSSQFLAGPITHKNSYVHYDFGEYRLDARASQIAIGDTPCVAWHSDQVLYKKQTQWMHTVVKTLGVPVVVQTSSVGIDANRPSFSTRIRCYQHVLSQVSQGTHLQILSHTHVANTLEKALLAVLIAQNHGFTYFALDPLNFQSLEQFETIQAALVAQQKQLRIKIIQLNFTEHTNIKLDSASPCVHLTVPFQTSFSILDLKAALEHGHPIPENFTDESILNELKRDWPHNWQKGFTLFFTGLSGAGKSTIANALKARLAALQQRKITLLDGDIVRHHLSSELTFSKEHRDLNIQRIGFVASEITKHGGVAICAPIAPYQSTRDLVRKMISTEGCFIEIHVSTPLDICEQRDRKGLYAQARAGKIKGFTGIDDPYEIPQNPELVIDTSQTSQEQAVDLIIEYLRENHFLHGDQSA